MKYDVFISYSRKDSDVANRMCEAFDKVGITYFIDKQGIDGGLEFPTVLAEAIINSRIFLYLASKNSYESKFTQAEITFAFNKKTKECILPYIIDGSAMPSSLEFVFSAINWRNLEEHPIESVLLDDLLRLLEKQKNSHEALVTTQKKRERKKRIICLLCVLIIATAGALFMRKKSMSFSGEINGYEFVDLGLSVKWASCNIGALSPEEYGDYFAWGEIHPITKEQSISDNFYLRKVSTYLENEDLSNKYDVAYNSWGEAWRMPNADDFKELLESCKWTRTKFNEVEGYEVKGPNGNSIFLPSAGMLQGGNVMNCGEFGYYWSSTKHDCVTNDQAKFLLLNNTVKMVSLMGIYSGFAIRPVSDR